MRATPDGIIALVVSGVVVATYIGVFWTAFSRHAGRQLSALAWEHGRREAPSAWRLGVLYWGSPLFLLGLWSLASFVGLAPEQSVPTPQDLAAAFWRLLSSGVLPAEAWISFRRVLVGFSCAAVVGVAVGLGAGSFLAARQLIVPVNSFLRYIPPTAFIALLIVYFGVGETYKYAVVFLGVIFFIVQMVVDVVEDVDARHIEMAQTTGFSNWDIFRRVIIPCSAPRVLDVLRINLSAAWTFLVAAELIGAERGLGHLVAVSQRFLRLDELYVGIVTFGIIGILTDVSLEQLSRRWFRWYYLSLKRSR